MLRVYRRQAKLSQSRLAYLSRVSVRTIRNLEAESVARPRPQTASLLAEALSLEGIRLRRFLALAVSPVSDSRPGGVVSAEQLAVPTASGGIFGRDAEMSFLLGQMDNERFINVTGVIGVGKTRLLLELARRVNEAGQMTVLWGTVSSPRQPDGVRPFTEPALAQAPVRFVPKQVDPAEFGALLGSSLTLLLLDEANSTQLGPEWLSALLGACPSLKVVAASREPLHVPGKGILPLEPLAVVPPGRPGERNAPVTEVPSLQLLLSSIRRVRPSFQPSVKERDVLAEICELLDGLPLALEQAGFQFLSDSPQAVASRLRHDPFALPSLPAVIGDGRGIRAALQVALTALDAPLADALHRLSKIEGDWSVREASLQFGWDAAELMSTVYELRMRGLLRCRDGLSEPQFRVLRLIRQLA